MAMMRTAAPPALSPERHELAAAISELGEHRARIAAAESAHTHAQEAIYAARGRHEAAEAAVEPAKAATTAHLIAVAAGTAGKPPMTVREARDAVTDAADDLAAARDAAAALAAELRQLNGAVHWLQGRVEAAAIFVLATSPEIPRVIARVDEQQRALANDAAALAWLFDAGVIPQPGARSPTIFIPSDASPAELTHRLLLSAPLHWRFADLPGAVPWQALLARLQVDAAAPLTLS